MILVSNNVVLSLSIALVLTTVYVVLRDEAETDIESSAPLLITLIFFCIAIASLLYFERTSIDENIQISNTVDPIIKMRRGRAPF